MMYFEIDDFDALREALSMMCRQFSLDKIPEETVFQSKLVADELLSNVLEHGGGRAFLTAAREGNEIALSVRGQNDYRPPEKSVCADVFSDRGRGLYLVDQLCARREYSIVEGIRVFIRIP